MIAVHFDDQIRFGFFHALSNLPHERFPSQFSWRLGHLVNEPGRMWNSSGQNQFCHDLLLSADVRRADRRTFSRAAVESLQLDARRHGLGILRWFAPGYRWSGNAGLDDSFRIQDESRRGVRLLAGNALGRGDDRRHYFDSFWRSGGGAFRRYCSRWISDGQTRRSGARAWRGTDEFFGGRVNRRRYSGHFHPDCASARAYVWLAGIVPALCNWDCLHYLSQRLERPGSDPGIRHGTVGAAAIHHRTGAAVRV